MKKPPDWSTRLPKLLATSKAARHAKYGDPKTRTKKHCSSCKEFLDLSAFGTRKGSTRDGYSARCRECEKVKSKEYRAKEKARKALEPKEMWWAVQYEGMNFAVVCVEPISSEYTMKSGPFENFTEAKSAAKRMIADHRIELIGALSYINSLTLERFKNEK